MGQLRHLSNPECMNVPAANNILISHIPLCYLLLARPVFSFCSCLGITLIGGAFIELGEFWLGGDFLLCRGYFVLHHLILCRASPTIWPRLGHHLSTPTASLLRGAIITTPVRLPLTHRI